MDGKLKFVNYKEVGTQNSHSSTETKYFFRFFFVKILSHAFKTWGHDTIWYFSCLCKKFIELRVIVFLSSIQSSQNMKFIKKCPWLSSLKTKFQWTKTFFWPLIRKVLIWTFWDYKSSWSKKSTPIQPWGVIGAPLLCIFKRCNSWECSVHFFRGPSFRGSANLLKKTFSTPPAELGLTILPKIWGAKQSL